VVSFPPAEPMGREIESPSWYKEVILKNVIKIMVMNNYVW
jgi:hypothetical protein